MTDRKSVKTLAAILWLITVLWLVSGCQAMDHSVIASTGTVIGVEVSQDPATQQPKAKVGYNRAELAIVPTNRGNCKKEIDGTFRCDPPQGVGGAKDTTDVLMELRYGGLSLMSLGDGIYQRLAVGKTAVEQPGAALMFAKDPDGTLSANAKAALEAGKKILAPDPEITAEKATISRKFLDLESNPSEAMKFEAAAKAIGYPKSSRNFANYRAFRDFLLDPDTTMADVKAVRAALKVQGITF